MTQARDAFNAAAQVGLSSFDKRTLDTVILGIKETTDATLSAAGTNTQVQYNNNGDFGASANFTWTSVDDLLTVGGNLKFSATGSAATTDTGIYSPGADQLAISTGGTGRLFVDANGNVTVDSIASAIGFFNARKGGAADQVFHIENRTTATGVDYNVAKTLKVNLVHGGKNAGFDAGWQFNSGCGSGQVSNNGYFAISKLTAQDGSSSSEVFRITSDGKLGLGTSSPPSLLSLSASNATPPGINIQNTTSSAGATASIAFSMSAVAGATGALIRAERLGGSAQSELSFWTGSAGGTNVRALTIDQSQRVGIGTATPGSALEINAAASTSPFIAKINTSEVARIDSSGRLLVGTSTSTGVATSGEAKLQIATVGDIPASFYSTADAIGPGGVIALGHARGSVTGLVLNNDVLGQIRFAGGDNTDLQTIGGQITCEVDGTPGANDMPGRLVFSTTADGASSPTERMRITQAGNVLIGSQTASAQLFVERSTLGNTFGLRATNASYASTVAFYGADRNTSDNSFYYIDCYNYGSSTYRFRVADSGNATNFNNSYLGISDIKLKENIVDANSQWDDVKALQVRNYNFKEGQTHTQIGLIAQEVELVSPGLVSESPDRDEDGNDLGTVTKAVNYSVLYMKAVKALQEAMERIEVLEAKVNALEGN